MKTKNEGWVACERNPSSGMACDTNHTTPRKTSEAALHDGERRGWRQVLYLHADGHLYQDAQD
jgi:hypothetical protein